MGAALAWLLAIEVLGLLAWPLTRWLLRALPDRGWAFTKCVGLLVAGYVLWIGATFALLPNTQAGAIGAAVALVLLGLLAPGLRLGDAGTGRHGDAETGGHGDTETRGRRDEERVRALSAVRAFSASLSLRVSASAGWWLGGEALFIVAFAAVALYRAYDPAAAHTEQPMDLALLQAAWRTERLPLQDPWFAGEPLPYYWFGYFLMAMLAHLSGVPPALGYNLALATVAGLAAQGAAGVVANLLAPRLGWRRAAAHGWVGAGLLLVLATWEGLLERLRAWRALPAAAWAWLAIDGLAPPDGLPRLVPTDPPDAWWWWRATRVIATYGPHPLRGGPPIALDYTITEFPLFSLMLGDLHPHVMGLPLFVLAIGLSLAVFHEAPPPRLAWASAEWPRLALAALLLGALGFVNSWDLPTGLALVAGAWALRLLPTVGWRTAIRHALVAAAGLLGAALLLYLPFYLSLRSAAQGLGVTLFRSQPQHFAIVWGPLLVLAAALLVVAWQRASPGWPVRGPGGRWGAALLGLALGLLLFAQAWVALGLLAALALSAWLLARARDDALARDERFAIGLVVLALALLLVPEFVFVRDLFGNRMNTVFKLSYQAWALLALSGGYALAVVGPALPAGRRWLWRGAVALALGAGLVYPALAPWSKAQGFGRPPTLDATLWLAQRRPAEAAALAWLRANAGPEDVVLEAPGRSYDPLTARVGPQTGLPTALGWPWHVTQWRGSGAPAEQRQREVATLYATPDAAEARRLLERLHVRWVLVGENERAAYPPAGLAKFERLLRVAYSEDGVTIYGNP
ncbi:MAG: hypothetical protein HY691_20075 [Chloroflexi bacterium]|nr:hypothetical protein [Chloroflexota bacterium]